MKKGLLTCSGGFSTTMMAQALDNITIPEGIKWDALGISAGGFSSDTFADYEIVLVSPQIRFRFNEIKKICDSKNIKCMQIDPKLYVATQAKQLYEEIKLELAK
ncbi:PTS sugar transporter subunit IIB [Spiroplasma alleghenense]|uniref:PTS system, cellobiose-specific IIB component n=1 Tax=Spiroplasma alleghenense TaxID=216931 RepID=A0A345Z4K1_9MOLU|nr:hypothetical protein [Spiroplasma alleghenense]AXK51530.1 PTS system, cellobiose-specific IIB component [Spiroplasma alleghenense]